MDQAVEQLASCIKKYAGYYKLFVKNLPEFDDPVAEETLNTAVQTANKETLTDDEVQELIIFSTEFLNRREQFLEDNPDLVQYMNTTEVITLLDNFNSALSTIKGS